jgi:hypothetical protein
MDRDPDSAGDGAGGADDLARELASVERVRAVLREELDRLLAELPDWSRPAFQLYDAFLGALDRIYPPEGSDSSRGDDPPSRSA